MYKNNGEKSMLELMIEQMDTTWRVVYMLIDRKPTAGDRWEWIGSEEKGYQVFLYLDEQLKQLRIEGGDDNGEV